MLGLQAYTSTPGLRMASGFGIRGNFWECKSTEQERKWAEWVSRRLWRKLRQKVSLESSTLYHTNTTKKRKRNGCPCWHLAFPAKKQGRGPGFCYCIRMTYLQPHVGTYQKGRLKTNKQIKQALLLEWVAWDTWKGLAEALGFYLSFPPFVWQKSESATGKGWVRFGQ